MSSYQEYHQKLMTQLAEHIQREFSGKDLNAEDSEFTAKVDALANNVRASDEYGLLGAWLINRILSHYPQLMESVPRELLWFFGSDCLHFLSEEEVSKFQYLEEAYFDVEDSGATADFEQIKSNIEGSH